MRRRILWIVLLASVAALTACKEDDIATKVAGTYTCSANAHTQMFGRDTVIASRNETVTITRIDEKTVSVSMKSSRWGEGEFPRVAVGDYGYVANLSGEGTFALQGYSTPNAATLSGSVTFDPVSIALTAMVKDYSSKLNIAFSNR